MKGSVPLLPASRNFSRSFICLTPRIEHPKPSSSIASGQMTTLERSRQRRPGFLHRHRSRSRSVSRVNSRSSPAESPIFEGTDAVTQNRKVALQRVLEVHDALELKHIEESDSTRGSKSSGSTNTSDSFSLIHLPNAEVRAFRYFLWKWDSTEKSDPEFEDAVQASDFSFEVSTIKHFFRRIALWHENEQVLQAARKDMAKSAKRKKKEEDSALGKVWMKERESLEHCVDDPLKEVTTREGLAQLLWTLMHDQKAPLAPELLEECTKALKRKYGIAS
jgi:hypothetical protein